MNLILLILVAFFLINTKSVQAYQSNSPSYEKIIGEVILKFKYFETTNIHDFKYQEFVTNITSYLESCDKMTYSEIRFTGLDTKGESNDLSLTLDIMFQKETDSYNLDLEYSIIHSELSSCFDNDQLSDFLIYELGMENHIYWELSNKFSTVYSTNYSQFLHFFLLGDWVRFM